MARRRSSGFGASLIVNRDLEKREIISWYRDRLASQSAPVWHGDEPVIIGDTWRYGENGWVLPEHSGGWDTLAWCGLWLKNFDDKPWVFTLEQARFIINFQAVTGAGDFLYTSAVLQRLKGWGKDPMAAAMGLAMAFGGSIPDGFDADGEVLMRHNPAAWVQIFAVSQEQTKNTMKLFPQLLTAEARMRYGVQVGRRNVWGLGDSVQIEASTSSPLSTEGNRPTFVIRNETQNWNSSNSGDDLAGVIDGNMAKAPKARPARMLDICNAYREGEDSIGQRIREGWEETQERREGGELVAAKRHSFGLYYDSLEAPASAPLTVEHIPRVVRDIRGDSIWLDPEGTVLKSVLNPTNSSSESRRKWYNQIQADEDAWMSGQYWDQLADIETVVERGERVVLFLDCSKSDDGTALVGARVLDGHRFVLGYWQKPAGLRGKGWIAPREAVNDAVERAFETFQVEGFFGDPSHVLEDESMNRYWDGLFDLWHQKYSRRLKVWARTGKNPHAVMFDMSHLDVQKQFVEQVAIVEQEIVDRVLSHDGDARLRRHVLAAKRMPTRAGMSIGKEHRESGKKIDLAVCMIGAGLVRRRVLNSRKARMAGEGKLW